MKFEIGQSVFVRTENVYSKVRKLTNDGIYVDGFTRPFFPPQLEITKPNPMKQFNVGDTAMIKVKVESITKYSARIEYDRLHFTVALSNLIPIEPEFDKNNWCIDITKESGKELEQFKEWYNKKFEADKANYFGIQVTYYGLLDGGAFNNDSGKVNGCKLPTYTLSQLRNYMPEIFPADEFLGEKEWRPEVGETILGEWESCGSTQSRVGIFIGKSINGDFIIEQSNGVIARINTHVRPIPKTMEQEIETLINNYSNFTLTSATKDELKKDLLSIITAHSQKGDGKNE